MRERYLLTLLLSPILYLAGVLIVLIAALSAETFATDTFYSPSFFVSSRVAFASNCLAIFTVGIVVFGLLSAGLYRVEGTYRSVVWAHTRHCWSLYALAGFLATTYSLLILFGFVTFLGFDAERDLTLFIIVVYAILLDALIGLALRRGWVRIPSSA